MDITDINILDALLMLFIVVQMYLGWRKGLILSMANIFGIIVAFFLSRKYFVAFGELLNKNIQWVEDFERGVVIKLNEAFQSNQELLLDLENGTLLNKIDLPEGLNIGLNQMLQQSQLSVENDMTNQLAEIIVRVVMNFVSFVLLFVLILLAIKLLALIINSFFQLPLLKGINQFGGLLLGIVISHVFIYLFMTVVLLLAPMNLDFGLLESIESSKVGLFYYNNNILFVLINYYL